MTYRLSDNSVFKSFCKPGNRNHNFQESYISEMSSMGIKV